MNTILQLHIKNHDKQTQQYELSKPNEKLVITIKEGDWIRINQSSQVLLFEILNNNDLKIKFQSHEVILKQLVKFLNKNEHMHIAAQFNDTSLLEHLQCKLSFAQTSLLDVSEIKNHETLMQLINSQKELIIENGLLKQILHGIKNTHWKKEHQHIKVFNEDFKVYSNDGFKVIVNL